ncbi:hypothetical protein DI392_07080 [Vibrio albus]|uniref:Uncharacterized protein n=1 Tax=Vibrio albus TaxID=2200953 RepID=A0A2U3BAY4_9VIBR|nr:hypothetical protein [Vibrio albus]PWI33956.1 hypothetical protein DI392_07080 [Vibrio albus]
MSQLTPEQESAIIQFKQNIHLPGDGFHSMIIELCKEYQLPFQKVRTIVMNAQAGIETQILCNVSTTTDVQLTKAHWVAVIRAKLEEMADSNVPLMEQLTSSQRYQKVKEKLAKPGISEEEREQILAELEDIYEYEVCNPLRAMLRTSTLFWAVKSDLFEMTKEQRQKFSDYPQHMEATEHLLKLAESFGNRC